MSTSEWLSRYASALGVDPPSEDDQNALLELAATAAHTSDRLAAPLTCWLAARSGKSVSVALETAVALAAEVDEGS
ncbi:MAG: DUF6457 domain-containing protein [Acidimicrobiales bacterium]